MNIRKILAPIDFSGRSREELRWATTLAGNFGAGLITLHVIPPKVADLSLRKGTDWDAMRGPVCRPMRFAAIPVLPGWRMKSMPWRAPPPMKFYKPSNITASASP